LQKDLTTILKHTEECNGCMVWTRALNTDGYPRALIEGNSNAKVHRVVYELANDKDISGYVVRHTCDDPKCINPNHLIIGTPTDNVRDRCERGRTHHQVLDEEKEAVKVLREQGITYLSIAQQLGISYKRVEYIVNKFIK